MISKVVIITSIVLTNAVFAADLIKNQNRLTVAAINEQKDLFNVRELHDMGASGIQQIDYVVNCADQRMALAGFSVINTQGQMKTTFPLVSNTTVSFYKPAIDHDQKITNNVCKNLMTLNSSMTPQ